MCLGFFFFFLNKSSSVYLYAITYITLLFRMSYSKDLQTGILCCINMADGDDHPGLN